jgi:hypothetical protein
VTITPEEVDRAALKSGLDVQKKVLERAKEALR